MALFRSDVKCALIAQNHPFMHKVMSLLQRLLLTAVPQNELDPGRDLSAVRGMVQQLRDYRLDRALHLALRVIHETYSKPEQLQGG